MKKLESLRPIVRVLALSGLSLMAVVGMTAMEGCKKKEIVKVAPPPPPPPPPAAPEAIDLKALA